MRVFASSGSRYSSFEVVQKESVANARIAALLFISTKENLLEPGRVNLDSRKAAGALLVFLSAVAFSAKAVIVKLAFKGPVDAITLLTLRMIFSFPFFAALAILSSKNSSYATPSRRDWGLIIFCGIVGYYLASLFDFLGLQYISAGLERLILFTYPTFVVLFSFFAFKQRISLRIFGALVLTYLGIGFVFVHDLGRVGAAAPPGAVLILLSALTYALYLAVGGRLIVRLGSMRFASLALLVSVLAVVLHFTLTRPLHILWELDARTYAYAFFMAVVCTVLPTMLLASGIRRIGSSPAAIIGSVGPISTIVLAWWFLGEDFDLTHAAGTLLVLTGVLIVSLQGKREPA